MTMTQKILARHAGAERLAAGDLITVSPDRIMANDITAPVAINELTASGARVLDPKRVIFVLDHFTPNKDIASAENCRTIRDFACKNSITNFYEGGNAGVEHALLPEQGYVLPSTVIIGADSHTCTYGALNAFSTGMGSTDIAAAMASGKAWFKVPEAINVVLKGSLSEHVCGKDVILTLISMLGVDGATYKSLEFTGNTAALSIDDKFTIANMSVEAGAKNCIFAPDETMNDYIKCHNKFNIEYEFTYPDGDYNEIINLDLSALSPVVAYPHLPSNIKTVAEAEKDNIKINQVIIGSCTNGRFSDLVAAAEVMKGKKTATDVRVIIIPATPEIYKKALYEGLLEVFAESGCIISPPTCGPCLGGFMGILAAGERAVSTTNRNFIGRMGHKSSEVYLASPYTAALCALSGKIGG